MEPITFRIEGVAAEFLRGLYEKYLKDDDGLAQPSVKQLSQPSPPVIEHSGPAPHLVKTIRPVFGSYVTRNMDFKEYLLDLKTLIDTYIDKKKSDRPLNILLAAPPGSGKSFLIKQIIKSIKTPEQKAFEEVYVPALDNVDELYAIFQRVQSLNLEGKLPFVFFDEIDAQIASEHIYAKFLAPMWDGTFYIGKEKFYLGKCVLFFAGSTLSVEEDSERILSSTPRLAYRDYLAKWLEAFKAALDEKEAKGNKTPDFVDRIDHILRIPPMHQALLGDDLILEHEDLACLLISKHFPTVKQVEKRALQAIVRLLATATSRRSAEKAVFASTLCEPQIEIFSFECLPRRDKEQFQAYIQKSNPSADLETPSNEYYQLEILRD